VSVQGKICIARYGSVFRGNKAFFAEERGAIGLLIYSDPIDDGFLFLFYFIYFSFNLNFENYIKQDILEEIFILKDLGDHLVPFKEEVVSIFQFGTFYFFFFHFFFFYNFSRNNLKSWRSWKTSTMWRSRKN